jgi:hypothetical protein
MKICDFTRSYIRWDNGPVRNDDRKPGHMPWGNRVRIKLDARCTLNDESTGKEETFVLIAACRSEWMYRDDTLFQDDSREFREVWTDTESISVGHGLAHSGWDETPTKLADRFIDSGVEVNFHDNARELEDNDDAVEASLGSLPIVARTEIKDEASGLRAVLEYPIHTMNFLTSKQRFQVDTGPLIFPDFSRKTGHWISLFAVAHTCYNTFDRAEFILRRPTPVIREGVTVCEAMNYSDIRRLPARNRLFEIGA